jgi:hypothetical protein
MMTKLYNVLFENLWIYCLLTFPMIIVLVLLMLVLVFFLMIGTINLLGIYAIVIILWLFAAIIAYSIEHAF